MNATETSDRLAADHRPRSPATAGFSLVEVLTALAVIATMLVTIGTALRVVSGAASRGSKHADEIDVATRGLAAFRRDVARMARATRQDRKDIAFVFEGDGRSLRFVVVDPAYPTSPGTYLVSYRIEQGEARSALVRTREPYTPDRRRPAGVEEESEEVVVLEGPYRFALTYLEHTGSRRQWVVRWTDRQTMPELVRLAITALAPGTPPLGAALVRPRNDAEIACLSGPTAPCSPRTGRLVATEPARPADQKGTPR